MILTRDSFRNYKTALMSIEGHPGSARLGEAMARGFGFPDHHALKQHFDEEDARLDWEPEVVPFEFDAFVGFNADHPRQTVLDMAMTLCFLHDGVIMIEDIGSYEEIRGGRVMLTALLPEAWKAAATTYLEEVFRHFGPRTWAFRPYTDLWTAVDDFESESLDATGTLRARSGAEPVFVPIGGRDLDLLQDHDSAGNLALNLFLESCFLRIRDSIPEDARGYFRYLAVDQAGVRAVLRCDDEDEPVEIVYLQL
ncbi:hypothetical protein [Defluviimonas salinarum]|uniref:DUF4261 domain-containing protein n=1 Tax=Defluviimonas salinarum TaxID=2992147 RepID=A0ABT3JA31_9RHOB|nr:hypothetical protein [Defluviimonas salinarum]MCW3784315.1 hypothetical protein [Defluviimonas salinarum]